MNPTLYVVKRVGSTVCSEPKEQEAAVAYAKDKARSTGQAYEVYKLIQTHHVAPPAGPPMVTEVA